MKEAALQLRSVRGLAQRALRLFPIGRNPKRLLPTQRFEQRIVHGAMRALRRPTILGLGLCVEQESG
jgi:hypothetical protein